jgi:DNA-binding response OmpR family regulator
MHAPSSAGISLFGSFRFDCRSDLLFRRDERGVFAPLAMSPRALDIIGVLVDRAGEVVSRAAILARVWPGTAIEDSNLNVKSRRSVAPSTTGGQDRVVSRPSLGAAIALPQR